MFDEISEWKQDQLITKCCFPLLYLKCKWRLSEKYGSTKISQPIFITQMKKLRFFLEEGIELQSPSAYLLYQDLLGFFPSCAC